MKTRIIISGQPRSTNRLLAACTTPDVLFETRHFNDYILTFNSKKAALKALSEGYKYLKQDREDWEDSCGGYRRGYCLSYDASTARFLTLND